MRVELWTGGSVQAERAMGREEWRKSWQRIKVAVLRFSEVRWLDWQCEGYNGPELEA